MSSGKWRQLCLGLNVLSVLAREHIPLSKAALPQVEGLMTASDPQASAYPVNHSCDA